MAKNRGKPGPRQRVRIIAGRWRGRWLPVVSAPGLRPTPDRVRETVFNWLQPMILGAECLDLFAGSGALGLEAASRGAGRVTLVERSAAAAAMIQRGIEGLAAGNARLTQDDALQYLRGPPFLCDLVFLDPPFSSTLMETCLELLCSRPWLNREARIYLEVDARRPSLLLPHPFQIERQGRAGDVAYCLARAAAEHTHDSCPTGQRWP